MKIRFPRDIALNCIQILVAEYDGEECTLDMSCSVIFPAGREFDDVEAGQETLFDVRLWLRDDLVAVNVPWSAFEVVEP
ncbi:MAG: hypothetical protein AB7I37_06410 [Pirellulales bacterium]